MSYLNNINLIKYIVISTYQIWHKRTSRNKFVSSGIHIWDETGNKINMIQKRRF